MTRSIDLLLPQLAGIMSLFTDLGSQCVDRSLVQIKEFKDWTDGQIGYIRLQAGAVLATAFLGGVAGIASAFFPKAGDAPTPPEAEGFLKSIAAKLNDNAFMRTTFKTCAKMFPNVGEGIKTLLQAPITKHEAERTLLTQVYLQKAQEGQSSAQDAARKANDIGDRVISKFSGTT